MLTTDGTSHRFRRPARKRQPPKPPRNAAARLRMATSSTISQCAGAVDAPSQTATDEMDDRATPPETMSAVVERLSSTLAEAQRCLLDLIGVSRLLVTCPTTRLVTRIEGVELLRRECRIADVTGTLVALLYVDIDHFKRFNDLCADHSIGDRVLGTVADIIVGQVAPRRRDCVIRWSGDELLVVLPATPRDAARAVAKRIQKATHSIVINGERVSVSIGLSVRPPNANIDAAVAQADAALYRAKKNGRDRVVCESLGG